jgi:hypothetical protein
MSDESSPEKSGVTLQQMLEEAIGEPVPVPPLIEIAGHEAGHAVIAACVGLKPIWVEINPVTGSGNMTPETPWHSPTPRQQLLILQAGSVAQCRLSGEPIGWTVQGAKDRVEADGLAEEDAEIDPHDFTEIVELLARADIWERVMRLAEALEVRHRIEIPELTDFLSAQGAGPS